MLNKVKDEIKDYQLTNNFIIKFIKTIKYEL